MKEITLKLELQAQVAGGGHGQNTTASRGDGLTDGIAWECEDYVEAVAGVRRGIADVQAGRRRPVAEFLAEVRDKYGFSG